MIFVLFVVIMSLEHLECQIDKTVLNNAEPKQLPLEFGLQFNEF